MTPRSLQLTGADGHALHLLAWSDAGVPLLLLHGFGNDAHVWDDFAPAVAPYYRTLALDQRGHGDSAHDPELRYDHDSMARDAIAALDALGIERVVLVGHSMGGRVAMRFARRHPERLAGLVIVDAGPELDARGVLRIRLDAESNVDPSFGSLEEYERVLARAYPLARPEVVARLARHGLRPRADGRLVPKTDPAFAKNWGKVPPEEAARRSAEETTILWEALRGTPCPTLVVRGAASDVLSPETADRMADEALPRGSLAVVPRAGHSVMLDNPEGFQDAVLRFVVGED
jgi:pimeloyl-ACP methyl ester carboxylesterase